MVFEKLTAIITKKNPAWGRLFSFALEKKEPGDPVLCWLRCRHCEDFLSPSNVSRAYDSHQSACRALKRQKVHVPGVLGGASGSVNQRLSFGEASGSGSGNGSGGQGGDAAGTLQVYTNHSCVCHLAHVLVL